MMPHDLPAWKTVYHYFRLWRIEGTWEALNAALWNTVHTQQGKEREPSTAIIDSQSVKTAEGGEERGYDAGKKVTGRKRHILVDALGLVMLVLVTAGNVQDREGARLLFQVLVDRNTGWCQLKKADLLGGWRPVKLLSMSR